MKQLLQLKKVALAMTILVFSLPAFSQPFIEVLQPSEANIHWELGSEKLISWNSNFQNPVKIDLINEDFVFGDPEYSTPIADSVTGSTYSWFIDPNVFTAGTKFKVAVTSTVNSSFTDKSENTFSLVQNLPGSSIHVENPNIPNIYWMKGSTQVISWSDNISGTVTIELVNYGANPTTFDLIASNVEGSTYEWLVPTTLPNGSMYKIKILASNDSQIADWSDNYFTISDVPDEAEIEVLQPSEQNITWLRGHQYLISWIDNIPGPVNLFLYNDDKFIVASDDATNYPGGIWTSGTNGGSGFGPWTISTSGGASAFIGDPAASGIAGMDNPSFGLAAVMDAPNNVYVHADRAFNSPLEIGSTLSFDLGFNHGNGHTEGSKGVKLYSGGFSGTSEIEIAVVFEPGNHHIAINGNQMLDWPVNLINLTFVQVSETEIVFEAVGTHDTYSATLSVSGKLDAVRFFSEEQHNSATEERKMWFNNLHISKYLMEIEDNVIGSTHVWAITNSIPVGNKYKVQIFDQTGTVMGESEYFFAIQNTLPGGAITVQNPSKTNIEWIKGSSYLISWLDNLTEPVGIELVNYGVHPADFIPVASNVTGSTHAYTVPTTLATGNQYKVKVYSMLNPSTVFDHSDNFFKISDFPQGAEIEVLQPSVSGITWLRGQSYLISWIGNYQTGKVNIELWKGGSFVDNLVTNYEGSTWVWSIPQSTYDIGNDYKIRVVAVTGGLHGESEHPFALADTPGGIIEVLQPNGGEILYKGTGYLISWIDNIPEPVNIELVNYDGPHFILLASNVVGSTWVFNVPTNHPQIVNGSNYKIKISSIHDVSIADWSNNPFTITDLPLAFSVYPNPVRDQFTVRFDEMANESFTVQLKDKYNMTVFEQVVNASQMKELNLQTVGIPNGVYFLTITSETSRNTQKILIQR